MPMTALGDKTPEGPRMVSVLRVFFDAYCLKIDQF
jgi:hypothetical protein